MTLDNFSNLSQLYAAGDCLVELLSAALHGKQAPALPAGVNWGQVCRLARLHSVDTMAFSAARDRVAREDPETFRRWDRWYAQNLVQHVVQQQESRSVCRCFYQAQIPAVPLKGAMLAGVYPRREYRQMSDLDILIPAPAAAAGEEILLKLGYERLPEEEQTDFHTGYQKPPYMAVELHTRLPNFNRVDPDFVRIRTFVAKPGTELGSQVESGQMAPCTDQEKAAELRLMLEQIHGCRGVLVSDHIVNLLESVNGSLAQDREWMIGQIQRFENMSFDEKREFQLARRMGLVRRPEDVKRLSPQVRKEIHLLMQKTQESDQWERLMNYFLQQYI